MNTVPQVLAPWYCIHGFELIEIGIGILFVSVLLKYNPTLRELVFAQKSIQNENDLATKVSKPSIQQQSNTHRCWVKITTRVDSLQVGYEHQITILVCDDDDEAHLAAMSLNDHASLREWRRKAHAAFDCLCIKYGLVKIQTIGSSFVALCRSQGNDDPKHAIQMIHFALACQQKLHGLVPLMKHDNVATTMRFGIHTGTYLGPHDVNGADHQNNFIKNHDRATMIQKTSLPGQIHLSKSTAKNLKSIGREAFVDRRTDGRLVVPTYWLALDKNSQAATFKVNNDVI